MIWKYLTEDIIGAASRHIYGKKGDRVYVVKNQIDMFVVINEKGDKFFVKPSQVEDSNKTKNIL